MPNLDREGRIYRRSVRLQAYDYRQPGFYYITICVDERKCLLGNIVDGEVHLSAAGSIVQAEWNKLPERFRYIQLDHAVIMPNHVHGIVVFTGPQVKQIGDTPIAKVPERFRQYLNSAGEVQRVALDKLHPTSKNSSQIEQENTVQTLPTLGEVVRTFKAAATYRIRTTTNTTFSWQSGMHEHVIRDPRDLDRIREYIASNPVNWQEDKLYKTSP